MNDIPTDEDLLTLKKVHDDLATVNEKVVGNFARRNVRKCENTMRLLRCNKFKFYASNNIVVSDLFVVLTVTHSSTEQTTWSDVCLHAESW